MIRPPNTVICTLTWVCGKPRFTITFKGRNYISHEKQLAEYTNYEIGIIIWYSIITDNE